MPIISIFLGIVIRINFGDHNPPHIHANYGDSAAVFEIATGRLLVGRFPRRQTRYVVEWIVRNRPELMRNWDLAVEKLPTFRIEGLADE